MYLNVRDYVKQIENVTGKMFGRNYGTYTLQWKLYTIYNRQKFDWRQNAIAFN